MIQAAQDLRETILTDLARRRNLATVQIDQLRAGRERLLDAYLVVRRTLDEVTDELQRAGAEAKAAADAVGRQGGTEHHEEPLDLRGEETLGIARALERQQACGAFEGAAGARAVAGRYGAQSRPSYDHRGERRTERRARSSSSAQVRRRCRKARQRRATSIACRAGKHCRGVSGRLNRKCADPSHVTGRRQLANLRRAHGPGPDTAADRAVSQELRAPGRRRPQEATPEAADNGTATSQERDVQGLFARIRASRAQATSEARKALSDQGRANRANRRPGSCLTGHARMPAR